MQTSRDWEKPIRRLEQLMRLRTFPIGLKLLEDSSELDRIPFLRRLDHRVTMCQLFTLVRTCDWTVGAGMDDFVGAMCPSIIGLGELPETVRDGTFRSIVWTKTKADGANMESSIPRIPFGRYRAVAMAPLVYNPFDPDMVLIYGNPAQMMLLINSLQLERYEVMQFHVVGETSCSDAVARCWLDRKPSLAIPCYGERRYGHAQDDELVMALPPESVVTALKGMETLYRRGIRYPISHAGAELDVGGAFPGSYSGERQMQALRGDGSSLLVGVTGGIGSGKSVVSSMLAELGSPMIDFDLLARRVVEPDQPAWRDIVSFFGEQVINEDRTLNRERLGAIVFSDLEQRKKLESFTHPRIGELFMAEVQAIRSRQPDAIIQVAIPLLIETNMQFMFDHLLVVHVPVAVQLERLMARDRLSRGDAEARLRAQMPLEDKVAYADTVIDNSGALEATRRQVEELWARLVAVRDERSRKREDRA
jgi:dephospho-CoA kinase